MQKTPGIAAPIAILAVIVGFFGLLIAYWFKLVPSQFIGSYMYLFASGFFFYYASKEVHNLLTLHRPRKTSDSNYSGVFEGTVNTKNEVVGPFSNKPCAFFVWHIDKPAFSRYQKVSSVAQGRSNKSFSFMSSGKRYIVNVPNGDLDIKCTFVSKKKSSECEKMLSERGIHTFAQLFYFQEYSLEQGEKIVIGGIAKDNQLDATLIANRSLGMLRFILLTRIVGIGLLGITFFGLTILTALIGLEVI